MKLKILSRMAYFANDLANLNHLCETTREQASIERAGRHMNAIVSQIGDLAIAGERMIERLRQKAFLPDSRKALHVRFGIAEAAQLLRCSTNRIRMAEDDGRLPPPPAGQNGRRLGYTVEELFHMREVLGASPARAPLDVPAVIAV